ncbi:MAG: hypothetical protein JXR77_18985, partial [Lentisphaeria bacterium]|nr:hypothetical protein [Lentisphaeria bacterium]
ETIWLYRRTFRVPALAAGERAWLVFERLDLAATVFLNGREAGRHANAFHPLRIDVTRDLREGDNTVVVEVESGLFSVSERPWQGYGNGEDGRLHKRHWLRKPQSSFSWDWSQRLINVGITGGVSLEIARQVRVDTMVVVSGVSGAGRPGEVTGRMLVEGLAEGPVEGVMSLEVAGTGRRAEVPVTIAAGMNRIEGRLALPDPELWWPRGHGAQPLYTVQAALRLGGTVVYEGERRVGFRHVRLNQDPHPEDGTWFVVEVNGKPIFCKGANLVPADYVFARLDRPRYAGLVDRAIEANANLLRVWGGGLYESDAFYDLCDERGILVWQEFIFACSKYPATDEAFLADVTREATHQVRRLAHHASLLLWCGNNELEWGCYSWGYERGVSYPDYAIFHQVLPRVLKAEDGSRIYHPSSPYSPGHEHPNADHTGDQHPWSVGFANTDFREYRRMSCRFPNEGGIMGPCALPTVRACLAGDETIGSFAWDVHENSIAFGCRTDRMLSQWLGLEAEGMGLADWVYRAGLLQGLGLNEYIRNFRRRMFHSASAIFWMYNDCWPMVRSWTIVDYYLRRTPAFHPVRRAFAPLTVAIAVEEDRVCVFGINEGDNRHGTVRYGLFALAGGFPREYREDVCLPANASTRIGAFPLADWHALGEATHGAFAILEQEGREVAREVFLLPFYKDMAWPRATVSVESRRGKAVFRCDTFAWRVCVDLDGERAYPDNFFDLLPGVPYELPWPGELGPPRVLRVGNLAGDRSGHV